MATTPLNVFCSRCVYFSPYQWDNAASLQRQPGECRRHVPDATHQPRWPQVSGTRDWCGEFLAKSPPGG